MSVPGNVIFFLNLFGFIFLYIMFSFIFVNNLLMFHDNVDFLYFYFLVFNVD